jgi:diguanylate cyclase (GGDEF)-like protein
MGGTLPRPRARLTEYKRPRSAHPRYWLRTRMSTPLDAIMTLVVERARALTRADGAVVELVEGEQMRSIAVAGSLIGSLGQLVPPSQNLSRRCVAEASALYAEDTATDPRVDAEACRAAHAASIVCVPLLRGQEVAGVLKVVSERPRAFDAAANTTLALLGDIIATAISQAKELADAYHASRHDSLTGLANRRAFDERLTEEIDRQRRYADPFSLAVLDLDGFKHTNDTHGQAEGDAALRAIGDILRAAMRTVDTAYRFGGDELALILPNTRIEGARIAISRLATAINDAGLGHGTITVSWGVVEAIGEPADLLCKRVDTALRQHKRAKQPKPTT